MDHEEEEKAEVLQKISFAQSELDLIEKESHTMNDQVSATEESLRSLKLRQLDVWEQQQLVDTLSHQKSHKEWLQDEQRQALRTAEGTAHILEQQALQTILTELMEEKKEIEAKQEECRRDAQKLTWEIQQVQRELLVPQEQVESLQVQLWHQLAGLQTLKEDFHEAEAAQCQAQLNVHVWEDKIADLEELFRLSATDRDQLAKQRGDHQRRLDAGKLRDGQLRAQWQDQENQIRDLAMAKLKLDRDWQRRICQRAEQEQALALVLADIALEEAFLHEQQRLHATRLQESMRQVQHDCAQTFPAEIAQLRQQEAAVLQEMLEAEEQVRNIRSHLVHHDTSIQDVQAQRLHALRRQDIDLAHQIQQQRRRAQTITERDLPLAQLHVQRLAQHEQLLRREEQQELSGEVLRAQAEVAQAEKAISDAKQALAIDTGVWKAAQKHAASLQAHTPAMLAEAEAQMMQSRDALQEAQTRLIAAQHRVGTTQDRQSAVTAQRAVVTQELQEAQERMTALTTELSQHEERVAQDEAQHRQVLQEIDAVERDVSSRIRRMETIQTIGTVDTFPRLLHLQRDVLPQVQQSSLQLQAQWHGQELRGQRFEAAWEGLRSLLDEGDEAIRQLREQAIRLQAALHDPHDPAVRQSVAVQHRLGELSAQINEARQTRDRIVSFIRENAQDAIHAPQNRLLYCTERAKDRQVLEADLQSSRRHLQDEQRRLEDQHATLAGIGIRMKRLQAEIAQLWQEKLQLVPASPSPSAAAQSASSSGVAAAAAADGAVVFTDAAHHWPTILLHKQLRLRQLQAQEAQLQRVEKHLWGTRAHVLAVHQRQLQHDLQQVASSALTASSSTAAAVVDMAKSLARASIASLHSSSNDNWALTLRGDASSSLLARSAGEVHLYGGSGGGGVALGLTQHAQYRQQQQWLQQTQRLTQEIASAAQELSRADQRRFILTRDWQEKLRQWLAWSEHEQHLTQDLRHQAEELQRVKQTRLTLQRLVAQRKTAAAQEAAAHPHPHHQHAHHSHQTHGHGHGHSHGHSHASHSSAHHAAPHHRASSPAPGSSAAGQFLTPHPNPYPNYLNTASTSRPSTPQRQLASSSGAASERVVSPLTTASPRASIGGRPSVASAAAVAALVDDRSDRTDNAAPTAAPSSAAKPSRIPMRIGSRGSLTSMNELGASSSAAGGEEDSELRAIALHSTGRYSPSAEWKQSNEERSPSHSKTPVSASNDANAAAVGAVDDEDIDASDVHTFASHELPFSPSHEMRLPFAVTGQLRGGATGNRAISPAAFVAGSKRTPLTPKITSGPKGASPERPLRVSLNRTWSNQSISQKLAKSARASDSNILTGGGGLTSPPPVVAKPTKKMVAMAAARQQQSQQVEDHRRKNQQLAAASFQF